MASSSPSEPGSTRAPVVLVVGGEASLRDAALARLRRQVLGGADPSFDEDRFDLAEGGTRPAEIIAAARTLPVLAERRLVIVRGLGDRRASRFLDQELLPYLEDPAPGCCLVLEALRVDRRLQWTRRIESLGEVVDCTGPRRPREIRAWIEERIEERGKRAAPGAAAALMEGTGTGLDLLAAEVDKLCLYAGDRLEVGPDDVAELGGGPRPRALYELTDAIGRRRPGPCLETLGQLLDQGEAPLAVLGMLASHFRRLARARECHPLDPGEVQRRLSVHPYAARKLAEQARGFDPRRIERCLAAIRRGDQGLKGAVPLPPRLAIERLVLAVCD